MFLWCFAQLFARRLSTTESNFSILFYYAIGGVIILGIATPFVWVNPTPLEWAGLLAVGVFGCLGQYFLILSLRYAPMSLLAPFEYSALVWASLYGFIFWGDVLGPIAIVGVAIIIAACLYITRTMEHSMERAEVDCVVIGAGVIGLACARRHRAQRARGPDPRKRRRHRLRRLGAQQRGHPRRHLLSHRQPEGAAVRRRPRAALRLLRRSWRDRAQGRQAGGRHRVRDSCPPCTS